MPENPYPETRPRRPRCRSTRGSRVRPAPPTAATPPDASRPCFPPGQPSRSRSASRRRSRPASTSASPATEQRLRFGGVVLADAVVAELTEDVVAPVPYELAAEVMSTYAGFDQHPFPGCFACGTDRPPPDGLGLRPGRVPGRPDCVATTWVPDASLGSEASGDGSALVEVVWAALDCPGGWSADLAGRPMVLGRMTAAVDALPRAGDPCVVVGQWLGAERRKTYTASTMYDVDGRVLGRAQATWIALSAE